MNQITRDEFAVLVLENKTQMYRLALGILKNEADAEDAVSDAIVKAYEHLGSIRDSSKFKSWIMTIVANEAKTTLKKKKKVELWDEKNIAETTTAKESTGIWEIVLSMDEEFRKVVILYYYSGFSIKEISKILRLPQGTVKSRLTRARNKLKAILENDRKG